MQARLSRPAGVRSLALFEVFTAVLLLVIGFLLVDFAILGFTGGAGLFGFGAVEFFLGLLSLAGTAGLWMGKGWSWILTIVFSAIAMLVNVALLAVAATFTLTVLYPGGPIVLLIIANDIIIAEMAVVYFLSKPNIKAYLGRS